MLFIMLVPGSLGQITFVASTNCSSLPAQCQCAGTYVTCTCLNQEEGLVLEQQHFSGRTEERVAVSNCANATISSRTFRRTRVQVLVLANITFLLSNDSSLPNELHFKYNIFTEPLAHFLTASAHFNIEVCNNSFSLMLEAPWTLHAREDVVVENNNFTNLPPFGLDVSAGARISFSFNYVGIAQRHALMAVTTEETSTLLQLAQNRFSKTEDASLQLPQNLTTQAVFVRDNIFEQPCTCTNTSVAIMRAIGVQAPISAIRSNERQQPWVLLSLCQTLNNADQQYIQVSVFISRRCEQADLTTTVFLSVFGSLLIVLACCVVVAWRRLKQKHLYATHSSTTQTPYAEGEAAWSRVMPEKQEYRNTDIREIIQKARELHLHETADPGRTRGYYNNNAILEHEEGLPSSEGTTYLSITSTNKETTAVTKPAPALTATHGSDNKGEVSAPAMVPNAAHSTTADGIFDDTGVQQEATTSLVASEENIIPVTIVDKTDEGT
ncbi:hypothetical protein FHG87_011698 [Trinorchestia longiramus]|nr:hypothetical protein FHG87_011698 [Trinorchestia longiramus]